MMDGGAAETEEEEEEHDEQEQEIIDETEGNDGLGWRSEVLGCL